MKAMRNKLIIWLSFTILGIGASVVIIFMANNRILNNAAAIQNLLTQAQASDAATSSLIEAKRQQEDLTTKLPALQTAFIQNHNPLPYLTGLEQLASVHGVEVNFEVKGNINPTAATDAVQTIPTVVTITGTWSNVVGFVNAMMQRPEYFTTTLLEINGTNQRPSADSTLTLEGNMYWQ